MFTAAILIALAAFGLTRPKAPEYVTDTAKRGDILRTVEAVGTVISERDLALQFPVTGIVANVLVREGQSVRAGEKLALLRAGTLAADIASASAAVQSAQADLNALLEGTRPEDIAIAEAELQSKRAGLDVAFLFLERCRLQEVRRVNILQMHVPASKPSMMSSMLLLCRML
jgi:HlyD family secretion protein